MKKNLPWRPLSRTIDDSKRPAAEKGLPLNETRYSTVFNKDQLKEVKALVNILAEASPKKKIGNVPPVQFKNLINEALTDLLKKYKRKKEIKSSGTKELKVSGKSNKQLRYEDLLKVATAKEMGDSETGSETK